MRPSARNTRFGAVPERAHGFLDAFDLDPVIAGDFAPGRPPQSEQPHAGAVGGARRIGGDRGGIGVRCVDQQIDLLVAEIAGEPGGAAEASGSHRRGLRQRLGRAARERHRHREFLAPGQPLRESPRLGGAAKNEDAHGAR